MRNYKKKQLELFLSLETQTSEWVVPTPLRFETDDKGREIPVYSAFIGYQEVKPYYASLSAEKRDTYIRECEINESSGADDWYDRCQACGHGIFVPWKIKHDEKKFVMTIGSECIKNFMKQDPKLIFQLVRTRQILDTFEKSQYQSIKNWAKRLVNQIWSESRFGQMKDGQIIRYENGRMKLEKKYHTLQSKLHRTNYDNISFKQSCNIYQLVGNACADVQLFSIGSFN